MKKILVSAPSSTMLFGEHAVLRSKHAIVGAIDRFLHLELHPNKERSISIKTENGLYSTPFENLIFPHEFRFIGGVMRHYKERFTSGFTLHIRSDIPQTVGLGSSAAVTSACVTALELFLSENNVSISYDTVLEESIKVVKKIQDGRGSGADIASIVYGGVIAFHADTLRVEKLIESIPITLVYSGNKIPTPVVIERVCGFEAAFPEIYHNIFETIESITQEAISSIKRQDFIRTGICMNIAQGCMDSLLVSNQQLSEIVWELRSYQEVYGSKISGSGLGDSVIALGKISHINTGSLLSASITPHGITADII